MNRRGFLKGLVGTACAAVLVGQVEMLGAPKPEPSIVYPKKWVSLVTLKARQPGYSTPHNQWVHIGRYFFGGSPSGTPTMSSHGRRSGRKPLDTASGMCMMPCIG